MAENNITRSSFEFKYAYTFGYLLIAFVQELLESASLISIASISIDRFLIVAHPLKHRYLIKERKVMVLWLSGIWLGSSTLPILRLFYGDKM